jgi:predicted Zn-dependent peptidase
VEAIDATLNLLDELVGPNPPSAKEISTASDMFLNSFAFRFDSAERIASEKAIYDLYGYPETYLDDFRSNIGKVTPASAVQAVRKVVRADELQIVVVGSREAIGDLSKFGPVTVISDVENFR